MTGVYLVFYGLLALFVFILDVALPPFQSPVHFGTFTCGALQYCSRAPDSLLRGSCFNPK